MADTTFYDVSPNEAVKGILGKKLSLDEQKSCIRKSIESIRRKENLARVTVEEQASSNFTSRETMLDVISDAIEDACYKKGMASKIQDFFDNDSIIPISGIAYNKSQGDMSKSYSFSRGISPMEIVPIGTKIEEIEFTSKQWDKLALSGTVFGRSIF